MYLAPILITTLNRYEHFKNLIESLQNNKYASETDIYIGLDYPPNEKYFEGYKKNLEYIERGITGFKSVNIIKHLSNVGAVRNLEMLMETVEKRYDRFIYTEDDNVFSPCFIEYMDKALELIQNDDDTVWVCGYSYPVEWISGSNIVKEQSFVSAWGFGTFFSKYNQMGNYLSTGEYKTTLFKSSKTIRNASKKNYHYFLGQLYNYNILKPEDVGYCCYQILKNKYCLMPTTSLVRNEGWDGSGIHCQENNSFKTQIISTNLNFDISELYKSSKDIPYDIENEIIINQHFKPTFLEYLKAIIKQFVIFYRYIRNEL